MIEQHRHQPPGNREIAGQQRHRAGLRQGIAQRQCVLEISSLLDAGDDGAQRAIRIAPDPQHLGQGHLRGHAQVELEADQVRAARRLEVVREHAFEMLLGLLFLAQKVQRQPQHAIADRPVGRIAVTLGHVAESFGERERFAEHRVVEAIHAQPPQCPQLEVCIAERFGYLERGRQCGASFRHRSTRVHERQPERCVQLHREPRVVFRRSAPTASARSTRARHSSIIDRCIHSGTAAAVNAMATGASPCGARAQSSAVRTLSRCRPWPPAIASWMPFPIRDAPSNESR